MMRDGRAVVSKASGCVSVKYIDMLIGKAIETCAAISDTMKEFI